MGVSYLGQTGGRQDAYPTENQLFYGFFVEWAEARVKGGFFPYFRQFLGKYLNFNISNQNAMETTNVCVVGAGPAGAATSLMLSKLGISHVILDRATFPRDKPCGDGLVLSVFRVLKEIDPALLAKFIKHPAFLTSFKVNFCISKQLYLDIQVNEDQKPYPPIFYGKRIDFDDFLVKQLPSVYADLRLGTGLQEIERLPDRQGLKLTLDNGHHLASKMVVGAEGIQSLVSRKLAKNKPDKNRSSTFITAYFQGLTGLLPENTAEIRLIYHQIPLFFYIFPLPGGTANVSLGGNSAQISHHKINLRQEVARIITTHPQVKAKFHAAQQVGDWRGWEIPSSFGHWVISGDNFLLVGDAAGLANSFYKEGVGTGMMSGLLAARKIQEALQKECFDADFLRGYDKLLAQRLGKLLSYSHWALKIARYPQLFYGLMWLLKGQIEKEMIRVMESRSY